MNTDIPTNDALNLVKAYWNNGSCGEIYANGNLLRENYDQQRISRYKLEPYLIDFAQFTTAKDKDVLEIGVGMGADHQTIAENKPSNLFGIDLTERAIEHAKLRFKLFGLKSNLQVANAELLPFEDSSFDFIYSWGVIHHSPNTAAAVKEIYRVLRTNGVAKIMIYHRYSLVGLMLWIRYALLIGNISISLDEIYSKHLESPGTKAYSVKEAKELFSDFSFVKISTICSFGDLLDGEVGQRHRGALLTIAKVLWPRKIIKFASSYLQFGLYLLVEVKK